MPPCHSAPRWTTWTSSPRVRPMRHSASAWRLHKGAGLRQQKLLHISSTLTTLVRSREEISIAHERAHFDEPRVLIYPTISFGS